ncbi:MAG: FAD-binding oxidoreductase [Alphaproteobacteria bacterium]|nr:FAD-binding oxidoreductase [Alphaproteobacteria bacterium]MCB9946210.1 FAD-binding oxidoreductase [Rhodospirillaceae bacterium]
MTDLAALKAIVGPKGWSDNPDTLAPLLVEPRGLYKGAAPLLLRPETTEQVAAIVRECRAAGVALVPQGGNTGLCGGASPDASGEQVLLSLGRMNRIRALDPLDYTVTVEAGCVLQTIQQAASDVDRLFPLSLGAEGSCQIGGNLSTNAGGINTLRYGNARDLVLGLEVVLPDGRIWNGLRLLRKDNTGYDLKHLFIGAEGTLGIITAASLKLFPKPREEVTAIAAVRDVPGVIELLSRLRLSTGDQVTAFEFMERFGIDLSIKHVHGVRDPLSERYEHYALMRCSAGREHSGLRESVEETLGQAIEEGLVLDAALAESEQQARDFWRIREGIVEGQIPEGGSIKHDVSVPVSKVAEFIARADVAVAKALPGCRPCAFGHAGDGNIHYNVTQPVDMDRQVYLAKWKELNHVVHAIVLDLGGSISAEHGIGKLKRDELAEVKSPVEMDLMRAIKGVLDPGGLMNPGKVV